MTRISSSRLVWVSSNSTLALLALYSTVALMTPGGLSQGGLDFLGAHGADQFFHLNGFLHGFLSFFFLDGIKRRIAFKMTAKMLAS